MRFFAHRVQVADCPSLGETIAHRLLKIELASAIRAAGWQAELEVTGAGWRADVLATAPDGSRRIAWEAQLAGATIEDLTERTDTMAADGVEVCWVTDKDTTWVTHVPSARVRRPNETEDSTVVPVLDVIDGHAQFEPAWCADRESCQYAEDYGQRRVPCPGHGQWRTARPIPLTDFVLAVCRGQVAFCQASRRVWKRNSRHDGGTAVWTTRAYFHLEREQIVARETYAKWAAPHQAAEARRWEEQAKHTANIEALLARQAALIKPVVELAYHSAGSYPRVEDSSPRFAMGVPVFVKDKLWAVICPVASRITPALAGWFATATIIVASETERARIAKVTRQGQRFTIIDPGPLPEPAAPPTASISIGAAVARMFGGY